MSRVRPPVLLFESNRGRDLRIISVIMWALVAGMTTALWLGLTEAMPSGDSPGTLFFAQLALLLFALLTDRRRRHTITRVYRLPEGLAFEMSGLRRPVLRYVAQAELGQIRASAPDVEGRMTLRLPDGGAPLVMHTGHAGFNLGLPEPEHRKR